MDDMILKSIRLVLLVLSAVGVCSYTNHTQTRIRLLRVYGAACIVFCIFIVSNKIQKDFPYSSYFAIVTSLTHIFALTQYLLIVHRAFTGSDAFERIMKAFSKIDRLLKYTEKGTSKLAILYTFGVLITGALMLVILLLDYGWGELMNRLSVWMIQSAISMETMLFFSLIQSATDRVKLLAEAVDVKSQPGEEERSETLAVEGFDIPLVDAHEVIREIVRMLVDINRLFRKQLIMTIVGSFIFGLLYVQQYIAKDNQSNVPMGWMQAVYEYSVYLMVLSLMATACHAGEKMLFSKKLLREALHRRGPRSRSSLNGDRRLASDLLRMVDCAPDSLTLCGLFTLEWKFLPSVLAMFISYAIIVIQYNTV